MNKNDQWIAKNFDKLVDLYGGRYVAVVNSRVVAVGPRPERVEDQARASTGQETPSVLKVPQKGTWPVVFSAVRILDI
jgi:hypothetical protein